MENKLIKVSKAENIFCMVTDILGGVIALSGMTLGIIFAAIRNNSNGIIFSSIFGVLLIYSYIMGSLYHGINNKPLKRLDFCSIYVMMFATYMPFIFCLNKEIAWILFGVIFCIAAAGITFGATNLKVFANIFFLIMLFPIMFFINKLSLIGIVVFFIGILLYLLSIIFACIKRRWMHAVSHIFKILALSAHIVCIVIFVV